jgi:cell wall assembly regulator SMI1
MSDSIIALTGLAPRPGASSAAIEAAERDLGVRIPEDYRAFLQASDGIEGFSGPDGDYLRLWSVADLPKHNRGYQVSVFAPGVTLIGSNGGGDALGFVRPSGKTVYVRLPFIPLSLGKAEVMGETLIELMQRLRLPLA